MGHRAIAAPAIGRLRRIARRSLPLLPLAILAAAPAAAADELPVTAQARAADAAWLPYAPPTDGGARTLCLVDSGVTPNPDIAPALIARTALDGGTPDDVDPHRHGTSMAMIAAAARDDAGMVGAWPAIRLRSVRAATPAADGGPARFAFADYARAVRVCQSSPDVAAVVLALGGAQPASSDEAETFVNYVVTAHDRDVNVVAAAGNDGGAVTTPGSLPGVLAVGAGDTSGLLCPFSSRGAGLDLIAPGCGLDTADPATLARLVGAGGSSQASVFAATVLVALRSYRPELSWQQAEDLLRTTAPAGALDVGAAFRAAGLGAIVDAGTAAAPTGQPPPSVPVTETVPPDGFESVRPARFPAPRVRASCHAGRVDVWIARGPRGALAVIWLTQRFDGRVRQLTRRSARRRLDIRLRRCPARVAVRFEDRYGEQALRSRTTVVAVRRIGRR